LFLYAEARSEERTKSQSSLGSSSLEPFWVWGRAAPLINKKLNALVS